MEIVWHGLSCFRMIERGLASIVTDPYGPDLGLESLKLKADIVTVSSDEPLFNNTKSVKGTRRQIMGPGEYEIGGVFITGLAMEKKGKKPSNGKPHTLYVFDFEGVTVTHLGNLSFVPSQAQIENLGAVDIALVPVGGGGALTPAQASEVISLIEPSIIVPMHFKTGKESIELGTATRFLKEMGITDLKPIPALKVSKSNLSEETQVVLLEVAK
jgi:L-ascorbate metabolism protein UlaG (beta-lactamase superfamily)